MAGQPSILVAGAALLIATTLVVGGRSRSGQRFGDTGPAAAPAVISTQASSRP